MRNLWLLALLRCVGYTLTLALLLSASAGGAPGDDIAVAQVAPTPLNIGQLIEKLGIIGILGAAIVYLQLRNEASEKRSQDFAERALTTLAKSTECIGDITEALKALKLAIAAETEETREMRRAIQESGRRVSDIRG